MFERRITISPATHRVHEDPKRNFGVDAVTLRFVLLGPEGAITWGLSSGWFLPKTWEWWESRGLLDKDTGRALGLAVCYHVPQQTAEWQQPNDCDVLPGGKCWGDCGFIAGDEFFAALVSGGDAALWAKMEQWYNEHCAPKTAVESAVPPQPPPPQSPD